MHYDLGNYGFQILFFLSIGFGAIAALVVGDRSPRWLIATVGAIGWFIGGLVASEILFGTMTTDEIQPIIDGLAYDEALAGGLLVGVVAVLVTWFVTRPRQVAPTS